MTNYPNPYIRPITQDRARWIGKYSPVKEGRHRDPGCLSAVIDRAIAREFKRLRRKYNKDKEIRYEHQ